MAITSSTRIGVTRASSRRAWPGSVEIERGLLDELDADRVAVADRSAPDRPGRDEPYEPAGDAAAAAVAGDGDHQLRQGNVVVVMRLALRVAVAVAVTHVVDIEG